MIKLFEFLIYGCWHRWKIVKTIDLYNTDISSTVPIGTRILLNCERCGQYKKQDLK